MNEAFVGFVMVGNGPVVCVVWCADDMLIKLWDWDKKWQCAQVCRFFLLLLYPFEQFVLIVLFFAGGAGMVHYMMLSFSLAPMCEWSSEDCSFFFQVFEGHTHYVMQIVINPKDNNTFASASLDRTVKVRGSSAEKGGEILYGFAHDSYACVEPIPSNGLLLMRVAYLVTLFRRGSSNLNQQCLIKWQTRVNRVNRIHHNIIKKVLRWFIPFLHYTGQRLWSDRLQSSLQVWQLGSPTPNFTLEGHEKVCLLSMETWSFLADLSACVLVFSPRLFSLVKRHSELVFDSCLFTPSPGCQLCWLFPRRWQAVPCIWRWRSVRLPVELYFVSCDYIWPTFLACFYWFC